jgi:hypothetical protein
MDKLKLDALYAGPSGSNLGPNRTLNDGTVDRNNSITPILQRSGSQTIEFSNPIAKVPNFGPYNDYSYSAYTSNRKKNGLKA